MVLTQYGGNDGYDDVGIFFWPFLVFKAHLNSVRRVGVWISISPIRLLSIHPKSTITSLGFCDKTDFDLVEQRDATVTLQLSAQNIEHSLPSCTIFHYGRCK